MASRPIPERPRYSQRTKMRPEDDPFEKLVSFAPKSIARMLKHESIARDLPMSRLLAIALIHEMERPDPFNLQLDLPDDEFVENAYADEAVKIYDFLNKFPGGTGIDTLWLFKVEIGIRDKERFLYGYRELLKSGMVEEFWPMTSKFRYAKDYKYVRRLDLPRRLRKAPTQTETGER